MEILGFQEIRSQKFLLPIVTCLIIRYVVEYTIVGKWDCLGNHYSIIYRRFILCLAWAKDNIAVEVVELFNPTDLSLSRINCYTIY